MRTSWMRKRQAERRRNAEPESQFQNCDNGLRGAGADGGQAYDSFQFVRNGFYCMDCKDSEEGKPVYNRIVSLKSSFRLPK